MKKRNSAKILSKVIITITLLTGLIVSGYALWAYYNTPEETTGRDDNVAPATSKQRVENEGSRHTSAHVTQYIKDEVAKQYEITDDYQQLSTSAQLAVTTSNHSAQWKPLNSRVYTSYDGGSTISFTESYQEGMEIPSVTTKEVRHHISLILESQFKLSLTDTIEQTDSFSGIRFYENNHLVCTVNTVESASGSTNVSCGEKDKYKEVASQAQDFYTLTLNPNDDIPPYAGISPIIIKDSSAQGYQTASANIYDLTRGGSSLGLFYKTPDSDWSFFTATQQVLPCSDYLVSEEIRIAFADEPCDDY